MGAETLIVVAIAMSGAKDKASLLLRIACKIQASS
jgi:hypothetical protein